MYLALSIFTGFMVALMIQFNGVLQAAAGGLPALLCIHISGLTASLVFFFFFRKRLAGNRSVRVPFWFLAAGMIGTGIVYLASLIFEKGGILLSLSGSLAGQTLAASAAEGLYQKEKQKSSIFQRILSPALLLPGSLFIGLKAGVPLSWVVVSWTPGILLMVQQSMNAQNTARYGTPATVVFNYVSALILIVPLLFIRQGYSSAPGAVSLLPWYVIFGGGLIGVFTTGSIAFLLLVAPALPVVLGIYTGEIAGGILLDLLGGNSVAPEKLVGIALVAAGLAVGKIRRTGRPS